MKVNTKSYPHPVLGNKDDVGGVFSAEFRYELSKYEIAFNPSFLLQNKSLEELIGNGSASFIAEVECRSTFFRTSFATKKRIDKFVLPAKLMRERVTVGFYICANENIKGYKPSECHPDYGEASFDIENGDVLAFGGFCSFIAEKNFDPLRPPVSSFMSIMEGTHHEGPAHIDYETEKITIVLSKADWRNYLNVRNQKLAAGILHASIALPALVDAIHQFHKDNGDYAEKNWFGRLENIIDAKGLREKEPFEAAQKILENPETRNFQSVGSLLEVTDNKEYE